MKRLLIGMGMLLLAGCAPFQKHKNNPHASSLTLGFVGDMMLGRLVNEQIKKTGCRFIWGDTLPLLQQNDLNIGNLETTLTRSTRIVPKVFNFKSDPANVCVLVEGNFSVVSLANNHSLDFSEEGLFETIETLKKAGIHSVGAGKDSAAAQAPVILKKKNTTIGILGCTDNEPEWIAQENMPGTHYIRVGDVAHIRQEIAALRPKVDILIVTLHWGPNMRQRPTQAYIDFAHRMVEAGADIIHGHSAHIVQGIEIYQNKIIMYDTGDFIDDYAVNPALRNDHSFLFRILIENKKLTGLHLIPVRIENMQVNKAQGDEAAAILKGMQQLSSEFNTVIDDQGNVKL